jgi:hypothetical protein
MNFNLPSFQPPDIKFKDDADSIVEDILDAVNNFNNNLDDEHEVGIILTSFGQTVTLNITGIGYQGDKLVRLVGYLSENGNPVELIQHVTQTNLLFAAIPRENPEEPKKEIGFIQS